MMSFLVFLDRRFGRIFRYGVVGAFLALLYTVLTIVFHETGFLRDPTEASMLASILTTPVAFVAHRNITYADVDRHHSQWRRFGANALSGFVISVGTMKIVDLLHRPYWIALAVCWFLVPAANYLINAVWVFRVKDLLALDSSKLKTVQDPNVEKGGA